MKPSKEISGLLEIMKRLRDPQTGCPWDVVQTFATISPYTIEEAHEVADAINRNDMVDLVDELGDLLLQVVFHARIAEEAGHFDFGDVVNAITTKMIRRHPHVFGDEKAREAGMAKGMWDKIKKAEKLEKHLAKATMDSGQPQSILADVPGSLPAVLQSVKLQAAAARVGFDWTTPEPIIEKIQEEIAELQEAMQVGEKSKIVGEYGDVLFAMTNLGRRLGLDPDAALSVTNQKFRNRFNKIESVLHKRGKKLDDASLDEMEEIWQQAKTDD